MWNPGQTQNIILHFIWGQRGFLLKKPLVPWFPYFGWCVRQVIGKAVFCRRTVESPGQSNHLAKCCQPGLCLSQELCPAASLQEKKGFNEAFLLCFSFLIRLQGFLRKGPHPPDPCSAWYHEIQGRRRAPIKYYFINNVQRYYIWK